VRSVLSYRFCTSMLAASAFVGCTYGFTPRAHSSASSLEYIGGRTPAVLLGHEPGRVDPDESVLYSFRLDRVSKLGDVNNPISTLVADKKGTLYGTAENGGSIDRYGGVFALSPTGGGKYIESGLYTFSGGIDPLALSVTLDSRGNLLGTTYYGNSQCECGTLFMLTPKGSSYTYSLLHTFLGNPDGYRPTSLIDVHGVFFGITASGGSNNQGTVFRLDPSGSTYSYTQIYSFPQSSQSLAPGGPFVATPSGALIGATFRGGQNGLGTVYKLTPKGSGYVLRVLYSFAGGTQDVRDPTGGLIGDTKGNLFGTAYYGGDKGFGGVYELSPEGKVYSERVIFSFTDRGRSSEYAPYTGVIDDSSGNLYGMTAISGKGHCGTVYTLSPSGTAYSEKLLYTFKGPGGCDPEGGLLLQNDGTLVGTASLGGKNDVGVTFKVTP
jgi:uncharacterized repeat protein (TIGR03803 family)